MLTWDAMHVVTALYDLGKLEGNPSRKSLVHYLANGRKLLDAFPLEEGHDLTIYCDPDLTSPLQELIRSAGRESVAAVTAWDVREIGPYARLETIRKNREAHPFAVRSDAAKDTPLYSVFQQTKLELLRGACRVFNNVGPRVAWIDFGLAGNGIPVDNLSRRLAADESTQRVRLAVYNEPLPVTTWDVIHQNVAAGYIAGRCDKLEAFVNVAIALYGVLEAQGRSPHDETVLEDVAANHPALVQPRLVPNHEHLLST